jgi:hypothetical protein
MDNLLLLSDVCEIDYTQHKMDNLLLLSEVCEIEYNKYLKLNSINFLKKFKSLTVRNINQLYTISDLKHICNIYKIELYGIIKKEEIVYRIKTNIDNIIFNIIIL